jgi:site-specific recombinase XerD
MDIDEFNNFPPVASNYFNYMLTIKGKSYNTVKAYSYDLELFFKFLKKQKYDIKETEFNEIPINDIDIDFIKQINLNDLYSFLSYVSNKRHNGSNARARKVACLKSFFNFICNKIKVIDYNPAIELESPKIGQRNPVYLDLDESKKLLGSISGQFFERDYAIITLFLNTGLRLSELVNIDISSIKKDTLRVTGKGNKERTVYLNKACIVAVKNYLAVRPTDDIIDRDALFLSKRKKRISPKTIQYIVKKYIKAAGLDTNKYSTHKLRHTAATLMYKYGKVDIRTLQSILGHSSVATTQIYTHVDEDILRKAVNKNPLSDI